MKNYSTDWNRLDGVHFWDVRVSCFTFLVSSCVISTMQKASMEVSVMQIVAVLVKVCVMGHLVWRHSILWLELDCACEKSLMDLLHLWSYVNDSLSSFPTDKVTNPCLRNWLENILFVTAFKWAGAKYWLYLSFVALLSLSILGWHKRTVLWSIFRRMPLLSVSQNTRKK